MWAGGLRAARFLSSVQRQGTRQGDARSPPAYVAPPSLTLLAAHTPIGNERHRFVRVSPPQLLCGYTEKQVPQYSMT